MANHVEDLIDAFGGLSEMARALGHKHVTTVQGWKESNRIPHWRHREILEAADRHGVNIPASVQASLGLARSGRAA